MRLLALFATAGLLPAHTLNVTGVVLRLEDTSTTVTVMAHIPMLHGADPEAAIPARLRLKLDGEPFHPLNASLARDAANDTVTWSAREERRAASVVMESPIFPDHPEDTTAVLVYRGGQLVSRSVLNAAHPSAAMGEPLMTVVFRFGRMGILHILSGPDHILFLLGLILAGGTARQLLSVVTGFTLAHSLTLSLTALGVASLSPRLVEPLIAFSIIVVGLENLRRRNPALLSRIALAFGFGFFHGFGFAGALTEVGLPGHAIAWSLGSFNIGVEIGQACILAVVLPMLALVRRRGESTGALVTKFASLAISLAGTIWFVGRVGVTW